MRYLNILVCLFIMSGSTLFAQTGVDKIVIDVNADHSDWVYKTGEKATFIVEVKSNNIPVKDVKINYEIGLEKMSPTITKSSVLQDGKLTIDGGTLKEPGFLRCIVTAEIGGKKYRGLATAAFEPQNIKATTSTPKDFIHFWDSLKTEASKIPLNADVKLITEKSTEDVNVYEVNLQNIDGVRVYGVVTVPKKPGKYPAILKVPGAGIRPYSPDILAARRGFIVFRMGIHGIPISMDKEEYTKLARGRLKGYTSFNSDNRNEYYFKRVYIGCIRAIDYLTSLPEYDGKNLGVSGGSQGGALTIVTAALDQRVKYMVAYFPGLCDLTGPLHGRTGGWPFLLQNKEVTKAMIETTKYYDVANFAKLIKIPGLYSWGFNDETCPPTSIYAAYNLIKAPKELFILKESGHRYNPIQRKRMSTWIEAKLTGTQEVL